MQIPCFEVAFDCVCRVYGDDGSQDDGPDDGQGSHGHAHKEGSQDSVAEMQSQGQLGRRGGQGLGSSSGKQ
eukprot:scaffold33200_cov13-Tisochrysis_lutea.AAC.1